MHSIVISNSTPIVINVIIISILIQRGVGRIHVRNCTTRLGRTVLQLAPPSPDVDQTHEIIFS